MKRTFGKPVDWEGMRLLDYPTRVPRPMDLGTAKKRLAKSAADTYTSAEWHG